MSECLKLKKKKENEGLGATAEVSDALASVQLKSVPYVVDEHYKPFMSTGFVSLTASSERVPVHILRDTWASQCLLCTDASPFSEGFVKGVEGGAVRVPLYSNELSCKSCFWSSGSGVFYLHCQLKVWLCCWAMALLERKSYHIQSRVRPLFLTIVGLQRNWWKKCQRYFHHVLWLDPWLVNK